ncbi:AarF/UbiB family protein [Lentisphaera marina]|uniref:ABC1 kinase family protein n=1 Tax=Lentisphaera marina TaxID=1111041 RepID=UPI00236711AB|nr:AarF/UbiB family protein [Lentisphaera marina]MDD7985619.1 AarF/UbiB family protein [Lentisphaera marina]
MNLQSIPEFTRDTKRFREVITVFIKYGLIDWIENYEPEFMKNLRQKIHSHPNLENMSHACRLRLAFTELGPTFIKLGQILSTREDLIGEQLAAELKLLQDSTNPDKAEQVRETLENELGKKVEELYAEFDFEAFASASVGQAHFAKLFDGTDVVVKIQHQGIEEKVLKDLSVFSKILQLAEKYDSSLASYQPCKILEDFKKSLFREMNFEKELQNMNKIGKKFADDKSVHIPHTYKDLSSKKVITMERLYGKSVSELKTFHHLPVSPAEIAKNGAILFLNMILRDGVYHADPHAGNIWILNDGRIGLLDFGLIGIIDEEYREMIEDVGFAALDQDAQLITDYVLRIGKCQDKLKRDELQADITEFLYEFQVENLEDIDFSGALKEVSRIIRTYKIILPSNISLLIKTLIMLEGTSRSLDRNFNFIPLIKSFQIQRLKARHSPIRTYKKLKKKYKEWDRLIEMMPRELLHLVENMKAGSFDVKLEHRKLDAVINRLVYGIIIAALFIGSSQLIGQRIPPMVFEISILGFMGYITSFVLTIKLLLSIRKSGDLNGK